MLGFYNYTVILTYIGMLAGFTGIIFSIAGKPLAAVICLLAAGLCDIFDGKVASTRERTREEKRFGVQIDSLSDLISFGALPAVMVSSASGLKLRAVIPAGVYLLAALIRLGWYNVDEEQRQDKEATRRVIYKGLPVTSAALIFPVVMLACHFLKWPADILGPIFLCITAVLFLLPFRIKKPPIL